MGALQIPIGTYHRSISCKKGSIVLNQAMRDKKLILKMSLYTLYLEIEKTYRRLKRMIQIID